MRRRDGMGFPQFFFLARGKACPEVGKVSSEDRRGGTKNRPCQCQIVQRSAAHGPPSA
jgi:hypothetical protein